MSKYDEKYEEWKKKRTSEGSTTHKSKYDDRYDSWLVSTGRVDLGKEFSSLYDTYSESYKGATDRFSSSGYRADTEDYLSSVKQSGDEYRSAVEAFQARLDKYGKYYDPKWVGDVGNFLTNSTGYYDALYKDAEKDRDFFSQFGSEDEYKNWDNDRKAISALYEVSTEEIKKKIANGEKVAYTTTGGQNITWAKVLEERRIQELEENVNGASYPLSGKKNGVEKVGDTITPEAANAMARELTVKDALTFRADDDADVSNLLAYYRQQGLEKENAEYLASVQAYAKDHPILGTIQAFVGDMLLPFDWAINAGHAAVYGDFPDRTLSEVSNALKTGATEETNWMIGDFDVHDFLYGSTLSMAESLAWSGTGYFAPLFMGLSAYDSEMIESKRRGLSIEEASFAGAAAAVFEIIFENFSIGHFKALQETDPKTALDILANVAKSSAVNSSEEFATEVANIAYDIIANGDLSEYETAIRQYEAMEIKDAKKVAAMDVGLRLAEAFASGALMGVGFGSVGSLGNYSAYQQQVKAKGESIVKSGTLPALMKLADEMAGVKDEANAKKISRLVGKVNTNASAKDVGNLSIEVFKATRARNYDDVMGSLVKKGVGKKDASRIAEYLTNGGTLTKEQLKEIDDNAKVKSVVKELIDNRESSVNKRNMALIAAQFGFDLKNRNVYSGSIRANVDVSGKVSKDGKTTKVSTGEEVVIDKSNAIKEIKNENGERVVYYNTDHGAVSANDITYANEDDGILYESFSDINPAIANAAISNYDGELTVKAYVDGMREGILLYGAHNFQSVEKDISTNSDFASLSKEDQAFALKLGREYAKMNTDAAEKAIKAAAEKAKAEGQKAGEQRERGDVTFEDGVKPKTMEQRRAVVLAKSLAKALGINIVFYDARYTTDKHGKGANGYFDPKTNSIHLDMQNGMDDKHTIVFTMSHELVHFIKKWSPAKFKVFADFLMEQYAAHGVSTSTLLAEKMAQIKETNADKAYEELIADACERMLLDSNAVMKLMELRKTDLELFEKIKLHILELLNRIRAAFKGVDPNTEEGKALQKMEDVLDKLHAMFEDAAVDAAQNYQTIGNRDLSEFSDAVGTDGEPLLQYKAFKADEAAYRDMLSKWGKMTDEQISNLFDTVNEAMDLIVDNLEVLDYAWESDIDDRAFFPIKQNSDKLYKVSLDFSTLCRKRILQQMVVAQLQEALNQPLTKEEGIAIRDALIALQEEGRQIEVACALCYVESARMKSPEQIKKFLNNREAVIKEFFAGKSGGSMKEKIASAEASAREKLHKENPSGIKGKDGKTMLDPREAKLNQLPKKYADEIRAAKKEAKESYKPTAEEQKVIDAAKGMSVSDFTTPEGLEKLAKTYPSLFDAYTSYVRNATKSKGIEKDTWWRAGDSESIGDVLIANMNKENGLRSQSWSDFQVVHILDYIAATIELATREAKEQAYSKVPDYVELMGKTGVMINMSLIPTAKFDGKLDYDSVEGMAYKRALELRDKYPETAGTICIGIQNEQIRMLLADMTIDYVIPYHKSGMSAVTRKSMRIPTWDNYEDYQGEGKLSREDALKNAKRYGAELLDESDPNYQKGTSFSEWFDLKEAQQIAEIENAKPSDNAKYKKYGVMYGGYMAMQNAAKNYLKLCAERGLSPKFSHEKADFTSEENYWKLLIDRKMVNNKTGEIIEQKPIKPIFEQSEVMRILNDELARYPRVKEDQEYAIRKVTEKFLSGEVKGGMSAEAIAKVMKKPVDNVTNVNILSSSTEVDDGIKKQAKSAQGNVYDYSKSFAQQIDDYKNGLIPQYDTLLVSGTPDVWKKVGFNALPVTINQTHVDYALNGTKDADHHIGEALLKDLPNAIQKPIAIIQSQTRTNRAVVIMKMVHNGKNVIGAIEVDGQGVTNNISIDSNAMTSIFAKSNALNQLNTAISNTISGKVELFYWNKKEAMTLLQKSGLQLSRSLPQDGLVHSIHDNGSNVKTKFENIFETQQFKRWFGDWQNNPKKASKVVNDDGTPMVVYHGSGVRGIDIFQTTNSFGTGGLYLTTNRSIAEAFAGNGGEVYETYVNLRKPLIVDAKGAYYDSIAIPSEMVGSKYAFGGNTVDTNAIAAYARQAKYDGVIIKNVKEAAGFGDDIIAFEPEQIKSATDNVGTFDGDNPNIHYQKKSSDKDYLDAVNRGDMETAQRMVDEAARAAGYDSPKLYHGTNAFGFTAIDNTAPGADGYSFWAANKEETSATYTNYGRVRSVSSELSNEDIESMLEKIDNDIDDEIDNFRSLIDRTFSEWYFGQSGNESLRAAFDGSRFEAGYGDGVYDVFVEYIADAYHQYMEFLDETYSDFDVWLEESEDGKELINSVIALEGLRTKQHEFDTEDLGGIYQLYANTSNMYELDGNGNSWNNLKPSGLPNINRPYNTRDVAEWAKNNGYNGVVFRNIVDSGKYGYAEASDVYAFFNPHSQVKSADPVTYDDNGNIIPLSDRFNSENDDIRYQRKQHQTANDTESGLTRMYESGEIDLNEWAVRMLGVYQRKKGGDIFDIARTTKEDASTTPKLREAQLMTIGKGDSKFYESLQKANIFDEKFKKTVESDDFVKHYQEITNKGTLSAAADRLVQYGAGYTKHFVDELDPRSASPIDTAAGFILLGHYQANGDYAGALRVAQKLRQIATAAGQGLQAFGILGRLDPSMMQAFAQSELDEAFKKMVIGKTKAWVAANKDRFNLTDEEAEAIRTKTLEAAMLPERSRDKAIKMAEIAKIVQDKLPPEKGQGFKAWQRTSLLLNPKTILRNIIGNVGASAMFFASDVFGTPLDYFISRKTGQRTKGIGVANAKDSIKAFGRGAYEAYDDYKRGIKTRAEELDRFDIKGRGKAFDENTWYGGVSKALNAADRLTSFLLEVGDRPFYEMHFMNSLNNLMRLNKVSVPTEDIIQMAQMEALERTWQDSNAVVSMVSKFKNGLNYLSIGGYGLGDVIIKFVKTPANITKAIYDFSPAALISVAANGKALVTSLQNGQFTPTIQKKFVDSAGKAIAGTMLYVIAAALFSKGLLTGDDDDDKDVAAFEKYVQGIPSYSIKIGDKWYSYDWAQPLGAAPAIVANFMESRSQGDDDLSKSITEAFRAGGEVLFNQSFMKSLQEIFADEDIFGNLIPAVLSDMSSNVPTLLSQIATLTDDKRRTTYDATSEWNTAVNKVKARIPFLRQQLDAEIDVLGRETPNAQNNVWDAFFNPANTYTDTSTEVTDHLYELYKATGDDSIIPKKADTKVTIKGDSYKMNTEERNAYQRAMGETSHTIISSLIDNDVYLSLSDEEKASVIGRVYEYSTAVAKSGQEKSMSFDVLSGIDIFLTEEEYEAMSDEERKEVLDEYLFKSYSDIAGFESEQKATWFVNKSAPLAFNNALVAGDTKRAKSILKSVEDSIKSFGLSRKDTDEMVKEAKSSIKTKVTTYWKEYYLRAYKNKNEAEMRKVREMLYNTGLYGSAVDVVKLCRGWITGN